MATNKNSLNGIDKHKRSTRAARVSIEENFNNNPSSRRRKKRAEINPDYFPAESAFPVYFLVHEAWLAGESHARDQPTNEIWCQTFHEPDKLW